MAILFLSLFGKKCSVAAESTTVSIYTSFSSIVASVVVYYARSDIVTLVQ